MIERGGLSRSVMNVGFGKCVLVGFGLAGVLVCCVACERSDEVVTGDEPPSGDGAVSVSSIVRERKKAPQTLTSFSTGVKLNSPSLVEYEAPNRSPIFYKPGDTFQGMWHYNRRNANLRLTIESVDPAGRTVKASMQSSDLDDAKKTFSGKVGDDGRGLNLTGIVGTGSEYVYTSGYHVLDFLKRDSSMRIDLTDCNARKLRGKVENGTRIYFWSEVRREE